MGLVVCRPKSQDECHCRDEKRYLLLAHGWQLSLRQMNIEQLIAEGRKIQRPCNFLKATGTGEPVAMWFEPDADDENITGWRRWITVRADAVPNANAPKSVYLSLYTKGVDHGLLDFVDEWPPREGIPLYAHPASVLPPIDAVFAVGSEEVGIWLAANEWNRSERYSPNFRDAALVNEYEKLWFSEHPIFNGDSEVFAMTGGWHLPGQAHDWHDLVSAKLLITTLRDSEPWVEAFQMPDGSYKVLQRIT